MSSQTLSNSIKIRPLTKEETNISPITNIRKILTEYNLNTVCQEAACPNLNNCWSGKAATFMIMGKNCTRRCGFCNITTARPLPLDNDEPKNIAITISKLKLNYVVITSVDRDDLPDCGSEHFAKTIHEIKKNNPSLILEVLIPDFKAKLSNLEKIYDSKPDILNHNVETVPSLYKRICPQSNYENSLNVLKISSNYIKHIKSGIILGLGETINEVKETILDLIKVNVKILTIGQYLQPSINHAPLIEKISIKVFEELKYFALENGVKYVESGPLVRSSYHAKSTFETYLKNNF